MHCRVLEQRKSIKLDGAVLEMPSQVVMSLAGLSRGSISAVAPARGTMEGLFIPAAHATAYLGAKAQCQYGKENDDVSGPLLLQQKCVSVKRN